MDLKEERNWGVFISLAGIIGMSLFSPVGNILAPLVLWLIKRNESSFLDDEGKEAVNFQITVSIAKVVVNILIAVSTGWWSLNAMWGYNFNYNFWNFGSLTGLRSLIWLANLIFSIIAATRASKGEIYRYPLSWRVVK